MFSKRQKQHHWRRGVQPRDCTESTNQLSQEDRLERYQEGQEHHQSVSHPLSQSRVRSPSWRLQSTPRWWFLEYDDALDLPQIWQQLRRLASRSIRRNCAAQESRILTRHIQQMCCKPFHSTRECRLLHSHIDERFRLPWPSRHKRGARLA